MTLADFMLLIGFVPPPDDARSDMRRWRREAKSEAEFLLRMWDERYPEEALRRKQGKRPIRSHRKAWPFVAKQESVVVLFWPPTRKSIKAIAPVIQLASRKRATSK